MKSSQFVVYDEFYGFYVKYALFLSYDNPAWRSKHRAADQKDTLFFSLNPLNDLVGVLRQGVSRRGRTGNAIQLEHGCDPGQGGSCDADRVLHFDRCVLCMGCRVEFVIKRKQLPATFGVLEVRSVGWHEELYVAFGLVQEMLQNCSWNDICG